MGFDKNGNWSSDFYPEQDRDNEVPITASKFQALIQDNLKQSFQNCILRDGTGLPTANINLNRKKITNLANASSDLDAVNKSQLDSAMATNATETSLGTVRIATEEEALAGEDDLTAISPLKAKKIISTLATSTRFAVNSGNATDRKPDLLAGQFTGTLSFKVDNGISYAPLTATTADAESFTLNSIASVDVSGLMNGTYNVFISPEGTAKVFANNVYRQQSQPATLNTNDIWFNTCEPFKAFIKTSEGLEETKLVQIPQVVVMANNVISSIETIAYYNDNGAERGLVSNYESIKKGLEVDWSAPISIPKPYGSAYTCPADGLCVFVLRLNNGLLSIHINGNPTGLSSRHGDVDIDDFPISFYVSKGDVITLTANPSARYEGQFFPLKGVI